MKFKSIISALVTATVTLSCCSVLASADGETSENTKTAINAEIAGAKGGAKSIVSMTYDDGSYPSAVWMNGMFEKYGLEASCMLIAGNQDFAGADWQAVFEKGYLSPENHSMTHLVLPAEGWSSGTGKTYETEKGNNTAENFQIEILDSKALLEETFGKTILTYVPSNNTLDPEATEIVKANYYAMRKGSSDKNLNKVQSLSPIEGSDAKGGWYNLYMYGIDNTTIEQNKSYVQTCIDKGGWFVSLTHAITNTEGKSERFEEFYKFLAEKQAVNDVWVTTFEKATIYLRERQNSTVSAYQNGENIFVSIAMSDTTGDGLPLTASVFNMPLTVKVQVPADWAAVDYHLNGKAVSAGTFIENGFNYAYVDVSPNSAEVKVSEHQSAVLKGYSTTLGANLGINFYALLDDNVATAEITVNGKKDVIEIQNLNKQKDGTYKISSKVSSINLREDITVKFFDNNGAPVDLVSSRGISFDYTTSVFEYADTLLRDSTTSNEIKAVAEALLNYGAYAETYFGKKYTGAHTYNAESIAKVVAEGVTVNGTVSVSGDISPLGKVQLVLDDATKLRIYINAETITVSGKDSSLVKLGADCIEIWNIDAKNLDTVYEFTVNGANIKINTLGVAKYVVSTSENTDAVNLMKALYLYSAAVEDLLKNSELGGDVTFEVDNGIWN